MCVPVCGLILPVSVHTLYFSVTALDAIANSDWISKEQVIEPVRSRCLCVRIPAPTNAEVQRMLGHVAKKENLALPDGLSDRIAKVRLSTAMQMFSKNKKRKKPTQWIDCIK
jgi:DNA polymerase III delta prime subunit